MAHIKMWLRYSEGIDQPILKPQFPMFFDLATDPGEQFNLFSTRLDMGWMFGLTMQAVGEFEKSVASTPTSNLDRISTDTAPRSRPAGEVWESDHSVLTEQEAARAGRGWQFIEGHRTALAAVRVWTGSSALLRAGTSGSSRKREIPR
jgi:hypothetical protein